MMGKVSRKSLPFSKEKEKIKKLRFLEPKRKTSELKIKMNIYQKSTKIIKGVGIVRFSFRP